MTTLLPRLVTLIALMALTPRLFADDTPAAPASTTTKPVLFQASKLKGADVAIKEDAQAQGGEYVMNKQAYNPVAFVTTPPGDNLTVWAHVRGSSFQLKAITDGKQQDLDWVWGTAGQFAWKKFGTYPRTKLGDQFLIIRGADADPNDGIDAILVSPDPAFSPADAKDLGQYQAP